MGSGEIYKKMNVCPMASLAPGSLNLCRRIACFLICLLLACRVCQAQNSAITGPATAPTDSATMVGLELCQVAPGVTRQIAVQDDPAPPPVNDPIYGLSYSKDVCGLIRKGDSWQLRFRVYYDGPDQPLAHTVAGLLCRYFCYGRQQLSPAGAFVLDQDKDAATGPAPSWNFFLDSQTPGGGKEQDGTMYLFNAAKPKNPVEVARIVAHEFSHMSLPAITGFGPPEDSANGYLGEVLYLQWLAQDPNVTTVPRDQIAIWANGREDAFINKFLDQTPPVLFAKPATYFWGIEGMLLYLKNLYGPGFLPQVLYNCRQLNRPRVTDLQMNIGYAMNVIFRPGSVVNVALSGTMVSEVAQVGIAGGAWLRYPAGSTCELVPGQAERTWICIPPGNYQLKVSADGTDWQVRGAIIGAGQKWTPIGSFTSAAPECAFTAPASAPGDPAPDWYELQWRNTGSKPVSIQEWRWEYK